ncbi:hypothetical protein D3C71_2012290 [compost metagenome]
MPRLRSNACRRRLTVGWLVPNCWAAADRLPASTMRTKVCISSMRSAPGGWVGRAWRVLVIRKAYNEFAIQPTTQRGDGIEQSPHSF